ncbi:MAG: hypothetical protein N3B21_19265 [Clostridia bacterium]|nr:hypothetical protein [Clostridia bacterium]
MAWMGTVNFTDSSKYNFGDLNRVNTDIQHLYDSLTAMGYHITLPNPVVTTYTRTNFPYVTAINNVRGNIVAIIQGFYTIVAPVIATNPSQKQTFSWIEANVIELNLQGIYDLLQNILSYFKYAGQFYCGEDQTFL